ncbi:MAG: phosphatidylserine decarboxylase [Campylobacterota bacterium]|nr:phosphatidylserine decarboxylase [Campylobacterota bacterium]
MHITNKISNIFHKIATKEFPPFVQSIINNGYVKLLGLDMSDFNDPASYKTLNKLFTRALRVPRSFDGSLNNFLAPADSFVTQQGDIEGDTVLQIKGMSYSLGELLTNEIDESNLQKMDGGDYVNYYLSPKDYHRYHSIYNCQITKLIHVPGKLYPVNFTYLNKQDSLFVENERVIVECKTDEGQIFYMVYVGALNVGKMKFTFEPLVETNGDVFNTKVFTYDDLHIKKGDCLGYFEMGSTVLVFWEKDFVELENKINTKVRFGEIAATVK